jgi:hypothetical protein
MSLIQQCLLDLIAPTVLQGGKVSNGTKKREKIGFFVLLALGYAVMFGMTIYFHFAR